MKKKLFLVASIATMALSLCACNKEESKKDDVTTTEATTTEATTEATTEEVVSIQAERGTVENGAFTNEVFDISFPIADDWYVYSEAEMAQIMGMSSDLMEENGIISAEAYEEAASGNIYDIMFFFSDMQSNASVAYQNLDMTVGGDSITEESYMEMTKYQLEQMTSPTYTISEPTKETYGGYEYTCLDAATDQGFSQKMLIRIQNNYVVIITVTYLDSTPEVCTEFLNSITNAQ